MRKLLFTLALPLIIFGKVYSQSLDCQKFKDGMFKIEADKNVKCTFIERKGNKQKETIEGEDGYSEFIVKWLNDCTYILTPTKHTLEERYPYLPKNAMLTVEIISVKEKSYIQTSRSNFADYEVTSEVIEIRN